MICVVIDELTPCLKDLRTGELVETEVIRIKRKSFLQKYNKKTRWYTNWADLLSTNEVYALVIKGSVDIQGLVALSKDDEAQAVQISWMCSSPENNKLFSENVRYAGIGGHLFAIAAKRSIDFGYDGYLYGCAASRKLLQHYIEAFHAEIIGAIHPYHFAINDISAEELLEVYNSDWADDEEI